MLHSPPVPHSYFNHWSKLCKRFFSANYFVIAVISIVREYFSPVVTPTPVVSYPTVEAVSEGLTAHQHKKGHVVPCWYIHIHSVYKLGNYVEELLPCMGLKLRGMLIYFWGTLQILGGTSFPHFNHCIALLQCRCNHGGIILLYWQFPISSHSSLSNKSLGTITSILFRMWSCCSCADNTNPV